MRDHLLFMPVIFSVFTVILLIAGFITTNTKLTFVFILFIDLATLFVIFVAFPEFIYP